MKKYFRTKEHIYKRLFIDKAIINELGTGACDKDLNPIGEQIIKESDKLEELCDQFVFVDDFYLHEHRVCHSFENAIALSKKHNVDIKTFRGAIWTDWGLKYVAELNDKGDLELL